MELRLECSRDALAKQILLYEKVSLYNLVLSSENDP
jgi:hypothetical protein